MHRYNLFNLKHKGLRAMLFDTAVSIQHTSFDNTEASPATIEKIVAVIHAFKRHTEHEDRFVLPAIEKFDPTLIVEFKCEHETGVALSKDLACLINAYRITPDKNVRIAAGCEIAMAFYDFVAFVLNHMNREERKLNNILWQHFHDNELVNIDHAIICSIPHDEMLNEVKWIMKGISNNEITCWLLTIKNTAPNCVFATILGAAEAVLPAWRFNEVKEVLIEGAIIY